MLRSVLVLFFAAFLSACATVGRQSRELLAAPPPGLPQRSQITHVEFVKQSSGYCGPATLTMAMRHTGAAVSIDEVAPEVYTPGKKGTLQLDLISSSRRHGLMAVPIEGLPKLLQEVAAGHPVIVLENLGVSWWPRWHYALVNGYDLKEQQLYMHSGAHPYLGVSMNQFEYAWSMAGYWGLVVLAPSELSATGDELSHLQAAVGLEQASRVHEADIAYQAILRRWPQSLGALVGLGNVAYKKREVRRAATFLRQALRLHPGSEVVRHNLSVVEKAL